MAKAKKQAFSGWSAIEGFRAVELNLKDALPFVPYAKEHHKVWSPRFTTIILEACSQLDSLWLTEAVKAKHGTKADKPNIERYFSWFGQAFAGQWAVLFAGEHAEQIKPFSPWESASAFTAKGYSKTPLPWWSAYNKLKHDRLANRQSATLENAVSAVAGLFLGIALSAECFEHALVADWITFGRQPSLLTLADVGPHNNCLIETALLAHPIGWRDELVLPHHQWAADCSARFQRWFAGYAQPRRP